MGRAYCYYCDSEAKYQESIKEVAGKVKGVDILYNARIAICEDCGHEIDIPDWDDLNVRHAHNEYRKKIGVITVHEIEEVMNKYNIGKKPLSKLLGWSESTIERYFNGVMPLKTYSDELKRIMNPRYMKDIFERNKENISDVAQRKLEGSLDSLLCFKVKETVDVLHVSKYFQSKIDDEAGSSITPLKMQKLVYFSQGWHLAFYDKPLFDSELQAWQHGPVSPKVYYEYNNYVYRNIDKVVFDVGEIFDNDQIDLLDEIYEVYGCFDGKVLEKMSHKDDPWKIARNGYGEDDNCQEIITNESIKKYFDTFRHMFDIRQIADIRNCLKVYHSILPM